MTKRIEHILQVLEEIRLQHLSSSSQDIFRLRIEATEAVAQRNGLVKSSVIDKYERQLKISTYEFDDLVAEWLLHKSSQLEEFLLDNSAQEVDRQAVSQFFRVTAKPESRYSIMQRLTTSIEDTSGLGKVSGAENELIEVEQFDPTRIADERVRVANAIVIRRGQRSFRQRLLEVYDGMCAITGVTTEAVLEAAHIFPYRGIQTNTLTNGLLLRADIHCLFDYGLIAIDENSYQVLISPHLQGTIYESLSQVQLRLPKLRDYWPSREALKLHRQEAALDN